MVTGKAKDARVGRKMHENILKRGALGPNMLYLEDGLDTPGRLYLRDLERRIALAVRFEAHLKSRDRQFISRPVTEYTGTGHG